ncbi:hypothetical protein [Rubellimicrobium mesophilum]|uniref:hypothetical protein n=1 Tax=Rubellimicrobium mesophilum TaxID=1123067 RepID=UPI0005616DB8|nr:hypothetical protein [Rubellimicrobium mesophilum]
MTIRARHLLIGVPLLLLGWIAVLALTMRLGGPAPAALVVLPPEGFLRALPPEVSVTSRNILGLTATGGPGLVAELYAAGAPLVLPAGLASCLRL